MKRLLFTISFLLCSIIAFSQIDYSEGVWDVFEDDFTNYIPLNHSIDSRNGYRLSPHGQIRFLMAFVELEYNNPASRNSRGIKTLIKDIISYSHQIKQSRQSRKGAQSGIKKS